MISEDEKWQGGSAEEAGGSREGYNKPYSAEGGKVGHTPRPRFKRVERAYGSTESGEGRAYRSSYTPNRGEGGAPRQGGYRPRYNNNENAEGRAYTPRPRYNNNGEGGGFRPRYNSGYGASQQGGGYRRDNGGEGGYRRENNGEGGFRPRYNSNRPNGRFNNNRPQRQRTADYDPNAKYSMKKRIEYKEINYDPEEPIRLNKFLANAGVCSRREADTYIAAGVVSVNGTVVTELGVKVKRSDEVRFHDQPVNMEKKVYILLNKPKDYVTTSDDPQNRKTVMDLVKNVCRERIYPVGRLDRNTTGVLMLTNDGDLASKLTHPKFLKKKIYHVTCDKNVSAADLNTILTGVTLEDGEIHADNVSYASPTDKKQIGIEIHSGKNRIVRRIFEHLGYRVVKLDRVLFAGLTKKNLRRGDWRFLTEAEVNMLRMGAFE
jgi:23S rRNA pseudouridine2605 synthase